MSNNLPLGAENDPRAPWNESEPKLIFVEVKLDVIVTRKVTIQMKEDYTDSDLEDILIGYAYKKLSKEKNDWKVMDIDYEMIK